MAAQEIGCDVALYTTALRAGRCEDLCGPSGKLRSGAAAPLNVAEVFPGSVSSKRVTQRAAAATARGA